jgi:lysophospholipase L1-like esterase
MSDAGAGGNATGGGMHASGRRIMPMGDSVTQGSDAGHMICNYRRDLWLMLQAGGYQDIDFLGPNHDPSCGPGESDFDQDNAGFSGKSTSFLFDNIETILASGTPDVVLLMIGYNDPFAGYQPQHTLGPMQAVIEKTRDKNPSVTFIIAMLPHVENAVTNAGIDLLDAALPEFAATHATPASPILLVDLRPVIDADTDTYDGIHPKASGANKMARVWYDALKLVL